MEERGMFEKEDSVWISEIEDLSGQPDLWPTLDPEKLKQLVFFQCAIYSATADEHRIQGLRTLYRILASRTIVEDRLEVLELVTSLIEEQHRKRPPSAGAGWLNALMPFIFVDPEPAVISSATLDMASMMPLVDSDPLTGPKSLLGYARGVDQEVTKVGILIGLLHLGDRRVIRLLDGCWRDLGEIGQAKLAASRTGFIYAGVIDFFLDWLEATVEEGGESFGAAASALVIMHRDTLQPIVLDVERKFPVTEQAPDDAIRLLRQWSLTEYAKVIEPRLRSLIDRESSPRLLPYVLDQWGLTI
jgi:hypothetical protein